MTERFTSPHDDSHVPPQQLLLTALSKYLSPRQKLTRVVWGEEPSLLVGGDIRLPSKVDGTQKKFGVSLTCDAWADPRIPRCSDEARYDVHLIGRDVPETITRYAVCRDATYFAQPMGRLSVEKFTQRASEHTVTSLVHLLHEVRFSKQSTDGTYDYLSHWGVIDASGAYDELLPDEARYNYMDRFYQETGWQE